MNPIGIAMDALLAGLLVLALILGLRLNRKLTALRAGQTDFARAVADLDAAALRAATGLADLRRASEDTHDSLLARIDTARQLIARLEGVTTAAALAPTVISRSSSSGTPTALLGGAASPRPQRRGGEDGLDFSPLREAGGVSAERGRGNGAGDRLAESARRPLTRRPAPEDELFEPADAPLTLRRAGGERR